MISAILVALGGALGALLRYWIGLIPLQPENGFPIKTLSINLLGSLLIGLVVTLAQKNAISPRLILFLKVGVCGGFTTFSSFALETEGLMAQGRYGIALSYLLLSLVGGILLIFLMQKALG